MTRTCLLLTSTLLCLLLPACSINTGTSGPAGQNTRIDPETNLFPAQEQPEQKDARQQSAAAYHPETAPADIVFPGTNARVTVTPGEREPASVGSYALRLYSGANPQFPYDDFVAGIVMPRNGHLEEIRFADIDGNGAPEIVVVTRSVGSGGYLSADAFRFDGKSIEPVAAASFLPPGADIEAALQR